MTDLAFVDQAIAAWGERLRRVDENLLALEAEATYQMLSGIRSTPVPLEGITKERVRPALDAMLRLFELREKVTGVLERAREIRATITPYALWGTEDKLWEIHLLLEGPSIAMGQVLRPRAERSLLDVGARDVALTADELLAAMMSAFEVARDAVVAVRDAWSKLEPALEDLEKDLALLTKKTERAAGAIPRQLHDELASIGRELAAARHAVTFDPLGAEGTLTSALRPRFVALRQRVDDAIGARARVEAALAEALALRQEVECARSEASRAMAEIARDFPQTLAAPRRHAVDEAALSELDAWYRKLEATVAAGHFQRAEIGVARYRETATLYRDAERAIVAARDGLVSKRTELKGRLSARRAQLATLVARGVVVPRELDQQGRDAEVLLGQRPLVLEAVAPLIDTFEADVVALSRR